MKILMTDADGTITFKNHEVDKKTIKSLKAFKSEDKNNITILATGRNQNPAKYILDKNNIEFDYYILSNGCLVFDKDFNVIYKNPINFDLEKICKTFDNHYRIDTQFDHYFTKSYRQSTNFPVEILNIIESHNQVGEDAYVVSSRLQSDDHMNETLCKLEGIECQMIRNNLDLDISMKGTDKYNGFLKLVEHLELENYELFAIGDSYNDVNMIQKADLGATFTYANDDIKKHCDIIVNDFSSFIKIITD